MKNRHLNGSIYKIRIKRMKATEVKQWTKFVHQKNDKPHEDKKIASVMTHELTKRFTLYGINTNGNSLNVNFSTHRLDEK